MDDKFAFLRNRIAHRRSMLRHPDNATPEAQAMLRSLIQEDEESLDLAWIEKQINAPGGHA